MSAALNPFYDDEEEEEEEEEDQEVDEEQPEKQSEYLLHLPDPCKTVARESCPSDQYSQKNTNSENREELESETGKVPSPANESPEDMLELEVDQSELVELGGGDGNGGDGGGSWTGG